MATIVVRPTDTQEEVDQKVARAKSGDEVKYSAGEYSTCCPTVPVGVTLRIGGITFLREEEPAEEPEETEEEEEPEETEEEKEDRLAAAAEAEEAARAAAEDEEAARAAADTESQKPPED